MADNNKTLSAAEIMAATLAQLPSKAAKAALPSTPVSRPDADSPAGRVYAMLVAGQNGIDIVGGKIGSGTAAMHDVFMRAACNGAPEVSDRAMTASLAEMGRMRPTRPHYATLIAKGLLSKTAAGYQLAPALLTAIGAMIDAETAAKAEKPSKPARKGKTADATAE